MYSKQHDAVSTTAEFSAFYIGDAVLEIREQLIGILDTDKLIGAQGPGSHF